MYENSSENILFLNNNIMLFCSSFILGVKIIAYGNLFFGTRTNPPQWVFTLSPKDVNHSKGQNIKAENSMQNAACVIPSLIIWKKYLNIF